MTNVEYLIRVRELNDVLNSINDNMNSNELIENETAEELGQFVTEVSDLIDQSDEFGSVHSVERDDLIDRINQFECDHIRVTEFLSRLCELLE